MQDYFDVVEYWKRLLIVQIDTPELLRKGGSRMQRRRHTRLLEDARSQLRQQMRDKGRARFRGEVAVDLTVFGTRAGQVPSIPHSVKRYLDAMTASCTATTGRWPT